MHIPDGYMAPAVSLALALPTVPLLAILSALSFANAPLRHATLGYSSARVLGRLGGHQPEPRGADA